MQKQSQVQLGKQGISENFISTLKDHFKKHENVRISVLKNAGHDKNKVKDFSQEILDRLGNKYTGKIIGFTIVLKKWRKPRR